LKEKNTTSRGNEKLHEVIKNIPPGSNILMCFGEIDCRVHLLKQSLDQKRKIEYVVDECVERYFNVIKNVKNNFNVMIWAVVPSTPSEKVIDARFPHFGTNIERNYVTKIFNKKLENLCMKNNITYITLFNKLINIDGTTNKKYFGDNVHLSQNAMPIAIQEIQKTSGIKINLFPKPLSLMPMEIQKGFFIIKTTLITMFNKIFIKIKSLIKYLIKKIVN